MNFQRSYFLIALQVNFVQKDIHARNVLYIILLIPLKVSIVKWTQNICSIVTLNLLHPPPKFAYFSGSTGHFYYHVLCTFLSSTL
jgi:hypothetical protein